jgi:hypothetical protein
MIAKLKIADSGILGIETRSYDERPARLEFIPPRVRSASLPPLAFFPRDFPKPRNMRVQKAAEIIPHSPHFLLSIGPAR